MRNVDGLPQRAREGRAVFGTVDSWLIFQLTGEHVTDATNASRTLLCDIHRAAWDDELLGILGDVPERSLPTIVPSCAVLGETRGDALPGWDGVPVAGVAGDQQAALVGQACLDPGLGEKPHGPGSVFLLHPGPRPGPGKEPLRDGLVRPAQPGRARAARSGRAADDDRAARRAAHDLRARG